MPILSLGYSFVPKTRSISFKPLCPPELPSREDAFGHRGGQVIEHDHDLAGRELKKAHRRLHRLPAEVHKRQRLEQQQFFTSAACKRDISIQRQAVETLLRRVGKSQFGGEPIDHFKADVMPRADIFAAGIAETDD